MNLVEIAMWVAGGAFLGWNVPQPGWSIWFQKKVVSMFRNATSGIKAKFTRK